ncbi:DUF5953 family protein [Myxococcaceae bacterium GXIMD 01537]
MKNTLSIKVYAPIQAGDEQRLVAAVHGLERALPGLRLDWTVSNDHRLLPLPQRDEWLVQTQREGVIPFVCNNDERHPVTMSVQKLSARTGPGGQPLLDIHAKLPLDTTSIAAAVDMLEAVATGAHAFWGHATPFRAGVEIARQTSDPVRKPQVPPRGLPALKLPEDISSPDIPHRLGWLNYWSVATARSIGFPDSARDEDLLSRARRTSTGGWIVPLTDAPLDLDNPAHLDALLRAYARFPAVGGRSTP